MRRGVLAIVALAVTAVALASGSSSPQDATTTAAAPIRQAAACPGPRAAFAARDWPPGCWRPYSAQSPFNRLVPSRPRLLPGSAQIVETLTGWGRPQKLLAGHADTRNDYFHPVYWSQPGDPVFKIDCVRFHGCPVDGHSIRIPDEARAAGGGDGHMAVIDVRSGYEYDFWQVRKKPRGGGRLVVSHGGRTRIDGSGLGSNATAAWFGLAAGMLRAAEVDAGKVNHALFAVMKCSSGKSVYPARRGTAGASCSRLGVAGAKPPPLGARIWLDIPPAQIAKLPIPGWRKAVLVAMNRYGMIVGDTTNGNASWGLVAESGSTFTSFGERDPWSSLGATVSPSLTSSGYVLSLEAGFDWADHFHILDPCVSRGRC